HGFNFANVAQFFSTIEMLIGIIEHLTSFSVVIIRLCQNRAIRSSSEKNDDRQSGRRLSIFFEKKLAAGASQFRPRRPFTIGISRLPHVKLLGLDTKVRTAPKPSAVRQMSGQDIPTSAGVSRT